MREGAEEDRQASAMPCVHNPPFASSTYRGLTQAPLDDICGQSREFEAAVTGGGDCAGGDGTFARREEGRSDCSERRNLR